MSVQHKAQSSGCNKAAEVKLSARAKEEPVCNPGQPCRMMQRTACYATLRVLLQQKCPLGLHTSLRGHSRRTFIATSGTTHTAAQCPSETEVETLTINKSITSDATALAIHLCTTVPVYTHTHAQP